MISPSRTITIGDKQYVLDGSFGTLRTVQESFKRDVVDLVIGVMDMRLDEVAKLIAHASNSIQDEIGQAILDNLGQGNAYVLLKTELYAWLMVALAPKAEREKKSVQMDEIVQKARAAFHGQTTNASPSDASAGSPANSGEATSGNSPTPGKDTPEPTV